MQVMHELQRETRCLDSPASFVLSLMIHLGLQTCSTSITRIPDMRLMSPVSRGDTELDSSYPIIKLNPKYSLCLNIEWFSNNGFAIDWIQWPSRRYRYRQPNHYQNYFVFVLPSVP